MSLHSEMTSVTFNAETKKCKPSSGPGVKTVWWRLQSSNKNADPDTVSDQSKHQTTHQALTCSMTAQQHKNNSDTTELSLSKQCLYWQNISLNKMTGKTRHQATNQSFTCTKMPQEHEKNVPNIVSLTLWSWLWAGKLLLGKKQLTVLYTFRAVCKDKKLTTLTFKCQ